MLYKELEAIPNLPEEENKILNFWKGIDIVAEIKKARKGKKEWVYYDGPITTNNIPHYGHAITWTMKDVFPRFWTMQDFFVARNMGWDTKGILVEYEVEKELGFVKKEDIEKFGTAKFIKYCRDFVAKYTKAMFEYESRLGRWFDESATYSTADANFVESEWWSLKELYKKGLLYEGYKVVAYSTRAGMTLSTHEVAEGGYKDLEDPFVTVKFKLTSSDDTYFLAWTTTPWTMPGNLMLAVNKKLTYVKVDFAGTKYILAKERVKDVFAGKKYKVLEEFSGEKLDGVSYMPPFDYFASKKDEGCFKVILSPHATSEEGTGIVHLAPYGEEDFEIFMKLGIKLFDYLDETANFTETIPAYKGLFYKSANPRIIEDLASKGALFNSGVILHRMPICYRTGTPLIYRPVKSWYVAVSKIKEKMQALNQKINWRPEHLKDGNSGMWISNARDWALSRSRYWGTPLPVWINDKTKELVFIGSFKELEDLSGEKVTDPHRPFVDGITWEDAKNGGTFKRVKDVIDVWYDSGSMPFAQLHYPFENKDRLNTVIPAEYISEGPDQVRLWFYTMLVLSTALFDKAPYKNVVTIGTMLDEHGKKLSKSKKNYKPMDEVLDAFGADVLRYFILTSSIVSGLDAAFSEEALKSARKEFFLPLWNCLKYFTTYANLNNFKNENQLPSENILDRWILIRQKNLVNSVVANMKDYRVMEAAREFSPFITDLSTWYIRRSRDRLKEGDEAALQTLFNVLSNVAVLLAPFTPFLSENIFEILHLDKKFNLPSVHMVLYPKEEALTNKENSLLHKMKLVMEIAEKGHSKRKETGVKVRQPLAKIEVEGDVLGLSDDLIEILKDELNVKSVKLNANKKGDLSVTLDSIITKDLELEGLARDLVRSIQDLRKESKTDISQEIDIEFKSASKLDEAVKLFEDYIKAKAKVKSLKPGSTLKIL